eukprot:2092044-Karenia_brevis.AAC.1
MDVGLVGQKCPTSQESSDGKRRSAGDTCRSGSMQQFCSCPKPLKKHSPMLCGEYYHGHVKLALPGIGLGSLLAAK